MHRIQQRLPYLREAVDSVFSVPENVMLFGILIVILLKLSGISEAIQEYLGDPPLKMVGETTEEL